MPCIYAALHCDRPNEGEPSEEHVVADALGGHEALDAELVCKGCNNHLNRQVDEPFVRTVRGVLNLLRIESARRGTRPNRVRVDLDTGTEIVPGVIQGDGAVRVVRGPVTPEPVEGSWTFRVNDEQELERMLEEVARRYSWDEARTEIRQASAHIRAIDWEGRLEPIYRFTAQTALNYLVFRDPGVAHHDRLSSIKSFIMDGVSSYTPWTGTTRDIADEIPVPARDLKPLYYVAVGGDGDRVLCAVAFFARLYFQVELARPGLGNRFHYEGIFDAHSGLHTVVDYWGHHPEDLVTTIAGDCEGAQSSRVVTTGEPPGMRTVHAHQLMEEQQWRRCNRCSSHSDRPPSVDAIMECHLEAIRR